MKPLYITNKIYKNTDTIINTEGIGCQAGLIETCGYLHYWRTGVSAYLSDSVGEIII